jgi:8-oxo-dGTP pyrophosphatase MutT (NUDIX family)
MYEVFFNDRKIVITHQGNIPFVKEKVLAENLKSVETVKKWFLDFSNSNSGSAILTHSSPELFWKELFLPVFKLIPAAGGVVIRDEKLLFIIRSGKWDLPKGKIDAGETAHEAAIREVKEECGIGGHQITKDLMSTYHIFKSSYKETYGQWILKETFWFEMSYSGIENGTPQIDENITKIRWFKRNELDEVVANTYENLKSVIMSYSK